MENNEGVIRRVAQEVARLLDVPVVIRAANDLPLCSAGTSLPVEAGPPISIPWFIAETRLSVEANCPPGALSTETFERVVSLAVQQVTVIDRLQDCAQTRDRFIADLLHGQVPDEPESYRIGDILGIDISRPRSVLLIQFPAMASRLVHDDVDPGAIAATAGRARQISTEVASFFRLRNESICAYLGGAEVAVLKACSPGDLAQWSSNTPFANPWPDLDALKRATNELFSHLRRHIDVPLSIAVGRYHEGLDGLRRSYEDCRLALRLGTTLHARGVHSLDDLGIAAFLGASDYSTKRSLAQRILWPLLRDPELLTTLEVFFEEDCSVARTSAELVIHRNTLAYRLDKVTDLCGLDPRIFRDAVQLQVALETQRLIADTLCASA